MVSGAISDSDTYVGGTWFVRFRSVVRTASVRGSYGFGPWFVRGRYDFGSYFDLTRSTDHPPLGCEPNKLNISPYSEFNITL